MMSAPDATSNESTVEVTGSSNSSCTEGSLHTYEVQLQSVLMSGHGAEDDSNHADGRAKEYFCGLGKCRPKWLQIFGNSKFFTFLMCLNATIEGALVSGMTKGISSRQIISHLS